MPAEPAATVRLDQALVRRGLARSRTQAARLVRDGRVHVDGVRARRPAAPVAVSATVEARADPYVSRAAGKLLGALDDLGLEVAGRALDAGASTGGFTQVLLERGCSEVVAVDVGRDQLAPSLRRDPRVRSWEQTHLRDLDLRRHLDGVPVDLVVADVSFISLTLLLAPLVAVVRADGALLLMVKPQFEVGREHLGEGGVVRSPQLWRSALAGVVETARALGWRAHAALPSRVLGPAGNQEFFVLLRTGEPAAAVALGAVASAAS